MKKIKMLLLLIMISMIAKGQEEPQYGEVRADGYKKITHGAFWKQRPMAKMIYNGSRPPGYTVWDLETEYFVRFVDEEHNSLDGNYIVFPVGERVYRDDATGRYYAANCGNEIEYIRPVLQTKVVMVRDTANQKERYFVPKTTQQAANDDQCCDQLIVSLSANLGYQYSYPQMVYMPMPMPMNYGYQSSGYYSDDYYSNTTIVNNNTNNYVNPDEPVKPEPGKPAPVPGHTDGPAGAPMHDDKVASNSRGGVNRTSTNSSEQVMRNNSSNSRSYASRTPSSQSRNTKSTNVRGSSSQSRGINPKYLSSNRQANPSSNLRSSGNRSRTYSSSRQQSLSRGGHAQNSSRSYHPSYSGRSSSPSYGRSSGSRSSMGGYGRSSSSRGGSGRSFR